MGVKGKGGEKGRNGVGVGPCLHQTMRKEDTLMYPGECQASPPSYPTVTLDSSLLDLRNQSELTQIRQTLASSSSTTNQHSRGRMLC